jgi:BirA family biotin operon repressor/biotin-[acetyl-CoA-carboxylase] ligase
MARETDLPEVAVLDVTESTNNDVIRLGREGAPHGAAVAARRQTLGRGRRGHVWVSPKGGLYFSVLVRPQVPRVSFSAIPAACGLAALDACHVLGARRVALKWPNDIIATTGENDGAKLGGILVEVGESASGPFAVCGIGVNLTPPPHEAIRPAAVHDGMVGALSPAYLDECVGSTAALAASDFSSLATIFRDAVVSRVDAWAKALAVQPQADGPLAPLLADYQASLALLGHKVRVVSHAGEQLAEGTFDSVDACGRAVIRLDSGFEQRFSSEQASLRAARD